MRTVVPWLLTLTTLAIPQQASAHPAQKTCNRNAVYTTYQVGNTLLARVADRANKEVLAKIREHVPDAPPIRIQRPEHFLIIGYDRLVGQALHLRVYSGFSPSPSREIYHTNGNGFIPPSEEFGTTSRIAIGDIGITVQEEGYAYTTGVEALVELDLHLDQKNGEPNFTLSLADACTPSFKPRIVIGGGLAALVYHGNLSGSFDASLTPNGPDKTMKGSYFGGGGEAHLLTGLTSNLGQYIQLMALIGYRVALTYMKVNTDVVDLQKRDGTLLSNGLVFQLSAIARF